MGEWHPPTAADYAQVAADRANEDIKKLRDNTPDLRDMFAGQAMSALATRIGVYEVSLIAQRAYAIADAMLAERKRGK